METYGAAGRLEAAARAGSVTVPVQQLQPGASLPSYAHPGDAGADLCSAVELTLQPGERAAVPTGVALALPMGYVALVHPRSGLALRHGITVLNAPGTIDAGYRGEIQVLLVNTDLRTPFLIRRGDRIAQLLVQPVSRARFEPAVQLPPAERGVAGFGSSGGFGDQPAHPSDAQAPSGWSASAGREPDDEKETGP